MSKCKKSNSITIKYISNVCANSIENYAIIFDTMTSDRLNLV